MRKAAVLLWLSLGLVPLTGCVEPPPPMVSIQPLDQSRVVAVEASLKADPVLAGCVIKVFAQNDLLVIEGDVPTEDAKTRAQSIAERTEGIKKIANHLVVKTTGNPNENTCINGSPQAF